jgi:cathepsin B
MLQVPFHLLLSVLVLCPLLALSDVLFDSQDTIARLRLQNITWKQRNYGERFNGMSLSELSATYLGVMDDATPKASSSSSLLSILPATNTSFDWRNTSLAVCIGKIVNQGKCGSCWAVSAVESMADRLCIRKSQHNSFTTAPRRIALSSLDVIACDKLCEGLVKCCRGCTGGYPKLAFTFFEHTGVVSEMCMPYNLSRSLLCPLPRCQKPIDDHIFKAKNTKQILGGAPAMRHEITTNGPVSATFTVYEDFMTYSSGIYKYSGVGKRLGLHAVKVVGFGISNGTMFWSCQNSWGESWGMNGSFNIAEEECGFEESVFTATPCLDGEICI